MSQLKVLGDDRRVLEPVAGCIATMKVEGGRSSCLLYACRWGCGTLLACGVEVRMRR